MKARILSLLVLGILALYPARANTTFVMVTHPRGDGILSLYTVHLKEHIAVQYRKKGDYVEKGVELLNHALRSRLDDKEAPMSLALIELVDHLQDHFHVNTVQVISGYRSPEFNAYLRRRGRRAAKYSRHMRGEAMDIQLPGVSARTLRKYLLTLHVGGVGYYGAHSFVHVDVGPFRTW